LHGIALDGTEDQILDDEADHDYGQQPGEHGRCCGFSGSSNILHRRHDLVDRAAAVH
jgi:hypothetical protein